MICGVVNFELNYLPFVLFPGTVLVDQAVIVLYDEQNR